MLLLVGLILAACLFLQTPAEQAKVRMHMVLQAAGESSIILALNKWLTFTMLELPPCFASLISPKLNFAFFMF